MLALRCLAPSGCLWKSAKERCSVLCLLLQLLDYATDGRELDAHTLEHALDAWIAPVAPDLAPEGFATTGDFRMNAIWSYAGLPVITFPTGTDDRNLPYSVQIIGRFGQDEALLNISRSIHQLIGVGELPLAWSTGVSELGK